MSKDIGRQREVKRERERGTGRGRDNDKQRSKEGMKGDRRGRQAKQMVRDVGEVVTDREFAKKKKKSNLRCVWQISI